MRKIKSLFLSASALLSVAALAGCATPVAESATAYGIVHKDYVGFATVTVLGDEIQSISIDEAFLPSTWAQVKAGTDADNVIEIITDATKDPVVKANFAKYVWIDGIVFTGSQYSAEEKTADGTSKQNIKYSSTNIPNLFNYVKTETNAKWYVDAIKAHKFYASNSEGKFLSGLTLNEAAAFKSDGRYWVDTSTTDYPLGWKGNVDALIAAMISNKFASVPAKNDDGKVVVGEVVTAATFTDFIDYYNVAKAAYDKIG